MLADVQMGSCFQEDVNPFRREVKPPVNTMPAMPVFWKSKVTGIHFGPLEPGVVVKKGFSAPNPVFFKFIFYSELP